MAKRTSRGVRLQQIADLVLSQNKPINTYQLSKLTDLKYSTKFVGMVLEAWQKKLIAGYSIPLNNGKVAYYWYDPKKSMSVQKELGI